MIQGGVKRNTPPKKNEIREELITLALPQVTQRPFKLKKSFLIKIWAFPQSDFERARSRAISESSTPVEFQAQGAQLITRETRIDIVVRVFGCTVEPENKYFSLGRAYCKRGIPSPIKPRICQYLYVAWQGKSICGRPLYWRSYFFY
jgi:hypothetical protein